MLAPTSGRKTLGVGVIVDRADVGMIVMTANILLRQANKTQNARTYLDDIITAKFDTLSAQGGVITGTTVNGKSLTLQALPGVSTRDVMVAAQLALSALECGLTVVPRQTYTAIRGL